MGIQSPPGSGELGPIGWRPSAANEAKDFRHAGGAQAERIKWSGRVGRRAGERACGVGM